MKAKKFLFSVIVIAILVMNACSDPETCADNPQLCLAQCLTNPEACIDEDGTLSEVPSDSIRVVSKLPVRE